MKRLNDYITEFININNIKKFTDLEYVDLNLPSGTKWAKCNLGANSPEDPGLFFQWGTLNGFKYNETPTTFKLDKDYIDDFKYKSNETLKHKDDAVYNVNNSFQIPSKEDILELQHNTNISWIKINDMNGLKFTSKQDDSKWIFIPAGGFFDFTSNKWYFTHSSELGFIWTSSTGNKAKYPFLVYSKCIAKTLTNNSTRKDGIATNQGMYGMNYRGISKTL